MKQFVDSSTNDSLNPAGIKILRFLKKRTFGLFSILFVFFLVYGFFNLEAYAYSDKQSSQLIERISKDYTKKFCNGIAFGLSKESAMNFAYKENNLIFKNKKGFENLNKKLIANNIAMSVIDSCGYPLNLKGEEGIKKFENEYISMNNVFFENE